MATEFSTEASELAESLRWHSDALKSAAKDCEQASDLILRLADSNNDLRNINAGLQETLDEQRRGLAELKAMMSA